MDGGTGPCAAHVDKVVAAGGAHRETTRLDRLLEAAGVDTKHRLVLPAELDTLGNHQRSLVRSQGLVGRAGACRVHFRARATAQCSQYQCANYQFPHAIAPWKKNATLPLAGDTHGLLRHPVAYLRARFYLENR